MDAGLLASNSDLAGELVLFFGCLNEATVSAAGYLTFSRSTLGSFYGILVTYVALLVQSV